MSLALLPTPNRDARGIVALLGLSLDTNTEEPWPGGDSTVYRARALSLIMVLAPVLIWLRARKRIRLTGSFVCLASTLPSLNALATKKNALLRLYGTKAVELLVEDIPERLMLPLRNYLTALPGYDPDLPLTEQPDVVKQHACVEHFIYAAFDPAIGMEASLSRPPDAEDELLAYLHGNPFAAIEFLPSAFGPGHRVSIYGYRDNYDPVDGWVDEGYYHLAGVARLPAAADCSDQDWQATVVDRLRQNGVVFLGETGAEAYLKTEGRYWIATFGGGHESWLRRFMWLIWRPKTAISDSAERLAAAITMARVNSGRPIFARFWCVRGMFDSRLLFSRAISI
jgi:hypothetical protein